MTDVPFFGLRAESMRLGVRRYDWVYPHQMTFANVYKDELGDISRNKAARDTVHFFLYGERLGEWWRRRSDKISKDVEEQLHREMLRLWKADGTGTICTQSVRAQKCLERSVEGVSAARAPARPKCYNDEVFMMIATAPPEIPMAPALQTQCYSAQPGETAAGNGWYNSEGKATRHLYRFVWREIDGRVYPVIKYINRCNSA